MSDTSGNSGYSVWNDAFVLEISGELSVPDKRKLHSKLSSLGYGGWLDWMDANVKSAQRYLDETTSPARGNRRRSQLKELDDDERLLVAYGAILLSQFAGSVAHFLPGPKPDVLTSGYARSAAGRLAWEGYSAVIDHWPFDEPPELSDPFE